MAGSNLSVSLCPSGYSDSPAVTSKSLRSPVWKYFSWEEAIGKSVCQVVGKDVLEKFVLSLSRTSIPLILSNTYGPDKFSLL